MDKSPGPTCKLCGAPVLLAYDGTIALGRLVTKEFDPSVECFRVVGEPGDMTFSEVGEVYVPHEVVCKGQL